jgi:hypothetical protein
MTRGDNQNHGLSTVGLNICIYTAPSDPALAQPTAGKGVNVKFSL